MLAGTPLQTSIFPVEHPVAPPFAETAHPLPQLRLILQQGNLPAVGNAAVVEERPCRPPGLTRLLPHGIEADARALGRAYSSGRTQPVPRQTGQRRSTILSPMPL
jgi:hypothetical protein